MARTGRPPKESEKIDAVELEKLMKLFPSEREVADWFGLKNVKTLIRFIRKHFKMNFVQLRDKNFVRTKIGIKRTQIDKALKGDNTMLIWCGKQYLNQRDKQSTEVSGPEGTPIQTENKSADLTDAEIDHRIKKLWSKVNIDTKE